MPPPCVPLPPQQGSGDAEAGECPRSQNMSTAQDGRRAAGASEVRRRSLAGRRSLALPSAATKSALSIKKGRMATLRTAAITPRESERAATAQALFRVLPKCPATLPGARSPVGHKPPPYLFVAERCDPWLPLVELLLEVAVLRRHRGAGSAWPPRGASRRAPSPRIPTTQCLAGQANRSAPQLSGAAFLTRATVQCRAEQLTCGCRLIGAAPGAGRGPRPPGGAPRAVQVCRPGCGCECV